MSFHNKYYYWKINIHRNIYLEKGTFYYCSFVNKNIIHVGIYIQISFGIKTFYYITIHTHLSYILFNDNDKILLWETYYRTINKYTQRDICLEMKTFYYNLIIFSASLLNGDITHIETHASIIYHGNILL